MVNSRYNTGATIAGTVVAVVLLVFFAKLASGIVFDSSGIFMFLVGACLAGAAGFGAVVIPTKLMRQASVHFVACALAVLVVLHYLWNFSEIHFFSKTTVAYILAVVGAGYAEEFVLKGGRFAPASD
jgi:hypothetical protein